MREDFARIDRQMPGSVPQIVSMRHEGGQCHARYTGGGSAEDARYRIDRRRKIWRTEVVWCNPPNAALGAAPTTRTANARVDAYLWVERPGYSNGACNGGPSRVGAGWRARADPGTTSTLVEGAGLGRW